VLLSSTGLLARTAADTWSQPTARARHDLLVCVVEATARGQVGVVTSRGRIVRLDVLDLPTVPPTATAPHLQGGAPLSEFLSLGSEERVLCLSTLDPGSAGLALGTAAGVVKRVTADHPLNKESWEVIRLADSDEVVGAAELLDGTERLAFVTSDAQLLHFPAADVRPQGRTGRGVSGVRLGPGERAVYFGAVRGSPSAVVVSVAGSRAALPGTEPGSVKVTPLELYPGKGRGTAGVRCHRFLKGEDVVSLAWVGHGPARAAASSGAPIELPAPLERRDGSGVAAPQPIAAVGGG
jgi:DNA gyrase subunit A